MSEWGPSYQQTDAGARQAAVRDALAHLFEASAGPAADVDTPGALDALHETTVEPYVELLALLNHAPPLKLKATASSFGTHLSDVSADGLSGELVLAEPADAASELLTDVRGKIALVWRGGCSFVEKMRRLQTAGAAACICVQTQPVWPFTMSDTANAGGDVILPSLMVNQPDGERLREALRLGDTLRVRASIDPHHTCSICLVDFLASSRALRIPSCRHVFHEECIRPWLARRHTCPTCRAELPRRDQPRQELADDASLEVPECGAGPGSVLSSMYA